VKNEKIQISSFQGTYSINNHNYLSETGTMRDIQWMESIDGKTIQYVVSTPSTNVTKDDLFLVANNMK
jgi:hypothetical protein